MQLLKPTIKEFSKKRIKKRKNIQIISDYYIIYKLKLYTRTKAQLNKLLALDLFINFEHLIRTFNKT